MIVDDQHRRGHRSILARLVETEIVASHNV